MATVCCVSTVAESFPGIPPPDWLGPRAVDLALNQLWASPRTRAHRLDYHRTQSGRTTYVSILNPFLRG